MDKEVIIAILGFLGIVLTYVFGPFIQEFSKKHFSRSADTLENTLKYSEQVDQRLEVIQSTLDADRITIIRFHNGGNFLLSERSVKKFSVFYEKVKLDFAPMSMLYQGVPVHIYHKFIEAVRTKSFIKIFNLDNSFEENYDLHSMRHDDSLKSVYAFAIYNINGQLIGVMSVYYYNEPVLLTEFQIRNTLAQVNAIGSLLNNN